MTAGPIKSGLCHAKGSVRKGAIGDIGGTAFSGLTEGRSARQGEHENCTKKHCWYPLAFHFDFLPSPGEPGYLPVIVINSMMAGFGKPLLQPKPNRQIELFLSS
jgi:hypothetical protein